MTFSAPLHSLLALHANSATCSTSRVLYLVLMKYDILVYMQQHDVFKHWRPRHALSTTRQGCRSLAKQLICTAAQNLAIIVLVILALHKGQKARCSTSMMSAAHPWQAHCTRQRTSHVA